MHRTSVGWALALALTSPIWAQSQTLVAPEGLASVEGGSNNGYPWNRGANSMRYMQIYDSSNLTAQGANGPLLITRLRFRADSSAGSWAGGTYSSLDVSMSTCPVDHLAASATFASNHGADLTTVHTGAFTINGGISGSPGPWAVDLQLTQPFVYNPANGDLVVDVHLDGATYSGGTLAQGDAVGGTTPPAANGTRVYSTTSATAATGSIGTDYTLVTEFTFENLHDLATLYTGTNGNSSGGGVYFDVDVNADEGIVVNALGLNQSSVAGSPGTLDVYVRPGASAGFEQSPAGWRNVAAAVPYIAAAANAETKVAIPDLVLPRGTWGFCVVCTNPGHGGQHYTTGAGSYSDAAITLTAGTANNLALSAGTVNSPRTWNGTIYYQAAARPLITTFDSDNGNGNGGGTYFDVLAHHASGVRITSFDINSSAIAGTPDTLSVWTRLGTSAGNEQSPAGWRQVASNVPFISAGSDRPSLVVLPNPILINGNTTMGIAMCMAGSGFNYTNGTGTNQSYSDGILDLTAGSSASGCLSPGTVFTPRVWNGMVHYQVVDPDLLQLQFNEPFGDQFGNSAVSTPAPRDGQMANSGWQGDPGRPAFRGNEAGAGMLPQTSSTTANVGALAWPANITGSLTVMWWQRMVVAPGTTLAYAWSFSGATNPRCFTGGVAGNSLLYRGSSIGNVGAVADVQANPGVWEHVALVVDDDTGRASWYINGERTNTVTFTPHTHTATGTDFQLARNTGSAGTGNYVVYYSMDDYRMYNQALTEAEIKFSLRGENASAGTYGTSCGLGSISGRGGLPSASAGNPAFAVQLSGSNASQLYVNVLGFLPRSTGPVNISPFFGPGCFLQTSNQATSFGLTNGSGNATLGLAVPRNAGLIGLHVYSQFVIWPLGAGAATRGLDISLK